MVRVYRNIPAAEEDILKTVLASSFGLFEFVGMPFSQTNAAQAYQIFTDNLFQDSSFLHKIISMIYRSPVLI